MLILKENNSSTIEWFCQISPLNIEGKIFFSALAQRLSETIQFHRYIDPRGWHSSLLGCLKHTRHQIQTARKEGNDLHVLFLDLTFTYTSSFPTVDCLYILAGACNNNRSGESLLVGSAILSHNIRPGWQPLEVGIMLGCIIFPLVLIKVMELIIRASKWVAGGKQLQFGHWL